MHKQKTFFFLDKYIYNRYVHKYGIHSLCLTFYFLEDKDIRLLFVF
jgi:hypothetical protein